MDNLHTLREARPMMIVVMFIIINDVVVIILIVIVIIHYLLLMTGNNLTNVAVGRPAYQSSNYVDKSVAGKRDKI